ncbi:DNA polymerase lambda-like isoform X2 [Antedon mediterranea]|uniref:DNA polymerase lambda-like isoform X2 n=1 Tax=Antedon mediterranea TaxID=105859 RepID=UPI003AF488CB
MEASGGIVKSPKNKRKHCDDKPLEHSGGFTKNKKFNHKKQKIEKDHAMGSLGVDVQSGFLSGIVVLILKASLSKARHEIFSKQVLKNGGKVMTEITSSTSHVIVAEEMTPEKLYRILNLDKCVYLNEIKIVKANWLSESLAERKLIDTHEFEINLNAYIANINDSKKVETDKDDDHLKNIAPASGSKWTSPKKYEPKANDIDSDDSSYVPSEDDTDNLNDQHQLDNDHDVSESSSNVFIKSANKLPKGDWACAKPSTNQPVNLNKHITDKLQVLQNAYENTKDQWRAFGYKKAINALKKHPTKVTTWEEASHIPGVGSKLADKITEIVESGHLRKIDHVCKGEEMEALNKFNNIWGVGPTTAQGWVQQGYRSLDDVMKNITLNRQQTIGMKYYDEFLERMPREEVQEIQTVVTNTAHEINSGYVLTTCGSFRRGKPTCGDIDILVSHPDGKSHKNVLGKLLDALRLKDSISC